MGSFGQSGPPRGPKAPQMPVLTDFCDQKESLLGRRLGYLFGTVFFGSLRDTKKGGLGGPSKLDPFFGRIWGLPGGPQEGSRLDGSSIFTLQPDPKRVPKWEPKWSLLGSQIRTILTLGHHLGEIGAQKAASKNDRRIWGPKESPGASWQPWGSTVCS